MNFALEELRQVDWLVIKIKQVSFLLYSLALCFFNPGAIVRISFFRNQLCKPQDFALLFPKHLAYYRAYFLHSKLGKYRNPLLLFHRLIFSTSELAFSHRNLIHSTQLSPFQQQVSFSAEAFAEGYNNELTSLFHIRNLANDRLIFSATNYA
jgi:hypothetical protein